MDTIRYYMNQKTHAHTTPVSWKPQKICPAAAKMLLPMMNP